MTAEPVVDVVIVNYNAAKHLVECLASVAGDRQHVGEIVVVDNASTDDSPAVVADHASVRWLEVGANVGFGAAANRGIAATRAPFVLLLNPDATVRPGAVVAMLAAMRGPRIGVVGPTVENTDGTTYPSARSFPKLGDAVGHAFVGLVSTNNPWSRRYLAPVRPEWISGTAMLVRRIAFEEVGGFDERYFMYVEDVDLCRRLAAGGWTVAVAGDAVVRHAIGGSSEAVPYRMIAAHHRSLWRYARRTTNGAGRLGLPVVGLGIAVRAVAAMAVRVVRNRPPAAH